MTAITVVGTPGDRRLSTAAAGGTDGDHRVPAIAVVGTPGDRRVTMFADACVRQGLDEPAVVPWTSVLRGEEIGFRPGTLVRIDSPGEDAEADALLRGPGEPSRIGGGARWHAGFVAGAARVRRAVAATPGAVLLADVEDVSVMFDKRSCHARLSAAGVPVPPALSGPVGGYAELRERMGEARWGRVFVKPAHGSSASGIVALHASGRRVRAVTSAELAAGGLHNSLRLRCYEDEADVAEIVGLLAADGLHVERWFPKAGVGGRAIDLRVVVVDGTPTHAVVRAGRGPITNLHLGGVRGELGTVTAALGPRRWERALEICARAAACFPGSLAAGVDLMIGVDWREFAVAEVNAFGDLLPRLEGLPGGGAEGLDTYGAQVRAILARHAPPRPGEARGAPAGTGKARGAPTGAGEARGTPSGAGEAGGASAGTGKARGAPAGAGGSGWRAPSGPGAPRRETGGGRSGA